MQAWVLFHGFLGIVLVAGLSIAIWQTAFPARRALAPSRIIAIAMLVAVVLLDLLGDLVYVIYRENIPTSPRNIILAGPRPWIHEILMEFKEHVAHFLPVILLVTVVILFAYDIREKENNTARKVVLSLFVLSFLLALIALLMGAYITGAAPIG